MYLPVCLVGIQNSLRRFRFHKPDTNAFHGPILNGGELGVCVFILALASRLKETGMT